MRKVIPVEALPGLAVETFLLLPLARGLSHCGSRCTPASAHSVTPVGTIDAHAGRRRAASPRCRCSCLPTVRASFRFRRGADPVHRAEPPVDARAGVFGETLRAQPRGGLRADLGLAIYAWICTPSDGVACGRRVTAPQAARLSALAARNVVAGAGVDAEDVAFVDEQRHAHDRAGLELGRLLTARRGVPAQTRDRSR